MNKLKSGRRSSSSVTSNDESSESSCKEKKRQRKTKISFEISPLLIMADMLDELRSDESEDVVEGDEDYLAHLFQL